MEEAVFVPAEQLIGSTFYSVVAAFRRNALCFYLPLYYKKDLVNNMQEAYDLIGESEYNFGVFIAGPSKTAAIEQSLVLGAHGPKTMTVFVIQ